MKGEINRNFYCSAGLYEVELDNLNKLCNGSGSCLRNLEGQCCSCRYRKWPTPKQYREEYGEEPPVHILVWVYFSEPYKGHAPGWVFGPYAWAARGHSENPCVIACTPWGKPPDTWRPEQ